MADSTQHTLQQLNERVAAADAKNDNYTAQDLETIRIALQANRTRGGFSSGVDISKLSNPDSPTLKRLVASVQNSGRAKSVQGGRNANRISASRYFTGRVSSADNKLLFDAGQVLTDDTNLRNQQTTAQKAFDVDAAEAKRLADAKAEAAAANVPQALSKVEVIQREQDDKAFSATKQNLETIAKDPNKSDDVRNAADAATALADKVFAAKLQEQQRRVQEARDLLVKEQTERADQERVRKEQIVAKAKTERFQANQRKVAVQTGELATAGTWGLSLDELRIKADEELQLKLKRGAGRSVVRRLGR